MNTGDNDFILEMNDITKSFPGTLALNNVNFKVRKGEVHALMGENGAGKSTLMKIAAGLYRPDKGNICFDGSIAVFSSPADALGAGISMIYQELNPVLHMTIAENIFLNREPMKRGKIVVDKKKMNADTVRILGKYNLDKEPNVKMNSLTIAQMQMVEILKAVTFNAKLIIMDEPTSSLDADETEKLFKTIKELKGRGISIIYISHRMDEIKQISDSVTVLRDGCFIGTEKTEEIDRHQLIKMMVGRELTDIYYKKPVETGNVVIKVKNLSRKGVFRDVSFEVREGEILGFAGIVGAGRSEIMKSIFSIDPLDSGEIYWNGNQIKIKNTSDAIEKGIAMVTEDRKKYGLVLCRSIYENISLPNLKRQNPGLFINHKLNEKRVFETASKLSVKAPHLKVNALNLSGGNQQKVILAKWIMAEPRLMILDEPTRGIDIGAKHEIYKLIYNFAKNGMAIILISSEMEEILGMSDRVLVIHEGRINGEFNRSEMTDLAIAQEKILAKALGV